MQYITKYFFKTWFAIGDTSLMLGIIDFKLTEGADGVVDWIDAAELAESVGITFEQYPAWLNSMHELGAVAVSDRIAH